MVFHCLIKDRPPVPCHVPIGAICWEARAAVTILMTIEFGQFLKSTLQCKNGAFVICSSCKNWDQIYGKKSLEDKRIRPPRQKQPRSIFTTR
jgi:hypothetical protein